MGFRAPTPATASALLLLVLQREPHKATSVDLGSDSFPVSFPSPAFTRCLQTAAAFYQYKPFEPCSTIASRHQRNTSGKGHFSHSAQRRHSCWTLPSLCGRKQTAFSCGSFTKSCLAPLLPYMCYACQVCVACAAKKTLFVLIFHSLQWKVH